MKRSAIPTVRSAPSRVPWRVPFAAIRKFARAVAEQFDPERIVLFGSYAYGKPHRYSDVDMLVVVAARNEIDKSVQILDALDPPFDVDLIVRSPHNLEWRLREGDWFLREIVSRGKVLYEKTDRGLGSKSGSRFRHRPARIRRQPAGA
jgi:uncharacterized protein